MNTIKYEAFLEVMKYGSLTQAAAKLSYSQPAISRMIKDLEKEYGILLLNRSSDKVSATNEALRLLPYLKNIVRNEESLREEVDRIKNIESGKINLGAYSSTMISFLPKLIQNFTTLHPKIEINLIESTYAEMCVHLRQHTVDFAVASQIDFPDYEFLPIMEDRLLAVLPEGHPLCEKDKITPEELFAYPLLSMEENSDPDLSEVARIYDLVPNVILRAKQETSLIKLIACNLGVGIVPSLYITPEIKGIQVRELDSSYDHREIGIVADSLTDLSPASKEFIQLIPEDFSELEY